jgi:hypothetical protein
MVDLREDLVAVVCKVKEDKLATTEVRDVLDPYNIVSLCSGELDVIKLEVEDVVDRMELEGA